MKKRNITLFTAIAAAAAFASSAQAAVLSDGHTGDYRIIFVTLGTKAATDQTIGLYNTFVNAQGNDVSSTQTASLSTTWSIVGSTAGTSAKVNTGTTGAGTGIHIYTPSAVPGEYTLIADSYAELWDNDGIAAALTFGDGTAATGSMWTGTNTAGDSDNYSGDASGPLGSGANGSNDGANNNIAVAGSGRTDHGWIKAGNAGGDTNSLHMLGMSGVIPEPSSMSLLALGGLALLRRRRA